MPVKSEKPGRDQAPILEEFSEMNFSPREEQLLHVCHYQTFMPARLIPQGELYAVPEPQLVVDGPEIVLDDVFCSPDFIGDFFVFESLSDEFDNSLLSVAWC